MARKKKIKTDQYMDALIGAFDIVHAKGNPDPQAWLECLVGYCGMVLATQPPGTFMWFLQGLSQTYQLAKDHALEELDPAEVVRRALAESKTAVKN